MTRKSGRGPNARKPKWKQLEDDVAEYYKAEEAKRPLVYHRFYDTHSANMFLPAQPGDHLVICKGRATVLETKYSGKHVSLVSVFAGAVKPGQLASARLWTRAGADYWVIFQGVAGFELWSGALLYKRHAQGKSLNILETTKKAMSLKTLLGGLI